MKVIWCSNAEYLKLGPSDEMFNSACIPIPRVCGFSPSGFAVFLLHICVYEREFYYIITWIFFMVSTYSEQTWDRRNQAHFRLLQIQSSDSGLCYSQQDSPSLPTGHHSGLHTGSTTPLCCHRPSRPSFQPCNCFSLVPTAELLHPRSPVVERSPNPHKNCSLPAHFPPQLENSPLHSVPRLLFGSFLIYCPFPITVLSPCILFSTYKL